jgi:predicted metalloprotease with PDZ domain
VTSVLHSPATELRSVEDMSRMAPFTDGGRTVDRTNWSNTYISYYPYGGAIALALDLSLRTRSNGRLTLDDFMRAMWRVHGRPAAPRPGYVAHPYTSADAEQRLAEVTGDPSFARDFFSRYVHGRELPDFAALLEPAGLLLQRRNPGRAWWGDLRLETRDGLTITNTPRANTPAYKAGLDVGDQLRQIDGTRVSFAEDAAAILRRHRPGDTIAVEYMDRTGTAKTVRVVLEDDPVVQLVTFEAAGRALTPAQAAFRNAWLGRKG